MTEQPTCGQGLAGNAGLPAALGEVMAAMAQNLDAHQRALDLSDANAVQEHEAYLQLLHEQRKVAASLAATAEHMAGFGDLPIGKHDMRLMTAPAVRQAFEAFVRAEAELLALLQSRLEQDRAMLQTIAGQSSQ